MQTTWSPARRIVLVVLSLVSAVVTLVATGLTIFNYQTTCGNAPTASEVAAGRWGMVVLVAFCIAPWAVAVWRSSSHRAAIAVAGTVGVSPAVVGLVAGLVSTDTWVGSWCF